VPPEHAGGRLVVCPTPIGNLQDVTLRVLATLREADVVACEDTRRTRVLLGRHGIRAAELVSHHEHNERERAPALVRRVGDGAVVALVSDAGMPVVSDPGGTLVAACLDAGLRVEVLPGPSAVPVALVASGMGREPWRFAGFLPRRRAELERALAAPETTVAFESPRRVAATLGVLAELDPGRPVAVCRELTKVHEEVVRGSAAEVARRLGERDVRGEVVLVVGAAAGGTADRAAALDALRRLVAAGARTRPAATVVASLTGVPANDLYRAVTGGAPGNG
jgi:16S rRNA (cytidine1402-2'-O)-methyltransferase